MKRLRIFSRFWLAAIFLFLSVSPGFSQSIESNPIEFWSALPLPDSSQMERLVAQYNVANPSRRVLYKNFSTPEELRESLETGTAPLPNLALVDSGWLEELKPKLIPADKILLNVGEMVRVMAETDTFPSIWRSCVLQEKAYAIPFSAETAALVVNLRLWKKTPRISTWQQWQEAGIASKKRSHAWGCSLPFFWDQNKLGELFADFISGMGKTGKFSIDLDQVTAGVNAWWNWINLYRITSLTPPLFPQEFGKSATWILSSREVGKITGKFIVEPLPYLKKNWGFLRVEALAFFEEKKSWDFANFLTDYAQLKFWAENTPTVPVNKQVYLSPDYLLLIDRDRPWTRTYIDMISRASFLLNSREKQARIGALFLKSLKKEITVKEAALRIHQEFLDSHPGETQL